MKDLDGELKKKEIIMPQKEHKNFKVSIILPNYNSSKYLISTISSIKNQTYNNWELIIVDDCSDNKTKKILKKYKKSKKIKIIWLKKNRGAAYCRNLAIKKSRSKYLAFIDSDDLWKKNKLNIQIKYMIKNNYDFTYTYYEAFYPKYTRKIIVPSKFNFKSFIKDTSIATSTMVIKRNIAKGIKFTNTRICEDYYFKCRVLKRIGSGFCIKKYLTKYRIRNNSLQSNKLNNFFWMWKINKNFNKLSFFANIKSLFFISISSLKKYGFK